MDRERLGKINTITMELNDLLQEHEIKNKDSFLSGVSSIICQLDTDIAIEVMESFGEEGKNEALSIKINYGY